MALSAVDLLSLVMRLVSHVGSIRRGEERFAFKTVWNYVVLDRDDRTSGVSTEYTNLITQEPEELEEAVLKAKDVDEEEEETAEPLHVRRARVVEPIQTDIDMHEHHDTVDWAHNVGRHARHPSYPHSAASERTLFGPHSPRRSDESLHESGHVYPWQGKDMRSVLRFVGQAAFATAERSLVFAGLMQVTTGIVVYTGGCRGNYINGCLAHLISEYYKQTCG